MSTGFVFDESFWLHDPGPNVGTLAPGPWVPPGAHVDSAEPKRRLKMLLDASGLTSTMKAIAPREAGEAELARVHSRAYIERVRTAADTGGAMLGRNAWVGPGGYAIAARAAGGALAAVDAVLGGVVSNAYALVRPSGHHAVADEGMGFCVFSNAALAARHALDAHGLARVAMLDWDVHHGNGAQAVFWDEPRVLTISLHQDGLFPRSSGAVDERGAGAGAGFNVNVPLPAGSGGEAYRVAFERVVLPALERFAPELIIVPCGYDAGFQDPLGRMLLGPEDFRAMARAVCAAAGSLCGGRLVLTQEGGYSAATVPLLGLPVFEELTGMRSGVDNPLVELCANMPGRDLAAHQTAAIEAARRSAGL